MRFHYLIGGIVFGFGLAFSEMTHQEVVLSFLQLVDLGLMFVMLGAIVVAALAFYVIPKLRKKAVHGQTFDGPKKDFGKNTVYGAVLFGVGWGLSGICPGSALASVGVGNYPVLIGLLGIFLGAYVQGRLLPEK